MRTAVLANRLDLASFADTTLKVATRFWFLVVLIGQSIFAFSVASFFGLPALRGDFHGWSKHITHGHIPGDTMGNFAVAMHLFSAVVIILAGVVQLVPQIRNRFPVLHRWNGRLYVVTAFTISIAGLYMMWIRGSVGDLSQHLGTSLMAVLIMLCAAMALRYALARDFKTHRRWALRLFLVVSASWFLRLALFLSFLVFKGPFGFDPVAFQGPFLTFLTFAQYLFPLGILEVYLWAQDRPGVLRRMATAGMLFVLTLAMGAGIFAVSMAIWVPQVKAAYDPRKSIAETLSTTITYSGLDQALKQYHELKSTAPSSYNFDEGELNALGYQL